MPLRDNPRIIAADLSMRYFALKLEMMKVPIGAEAAESLKEMEKLYEAAMKECRDRIPD